MDTVPVTPEGLEKLKAELLAVERKVLSDTGRLAAAREQGDLSENADYHAAKEELGWLNAQINAMRGRIAICRIVDEKDLPKDLAVMGARVTLEDTGAGREVVYTLVGEGQADSAQRKILTTSPIGSALLRKKVGDPVEVKAPKGLIKYKVKKIEYGG